MLIRSFLIQGNIYHSPKRFRLRLIDSKELGVIITHIKLMSLTKHFLKIMFYYKINFISTLGVPIIYLIFNMRNDIFHHSSMFPLSMMILSWTGYMIVTYALMGSGPAIIVLREEQFIKMFRFIVGNHFLIVYAKFMTQLITLLFSIIIIDVLCSILFYIPFLFLFGISLIMILICDVPIYLLLLFFGALNIRQETVMPIVNILILIFIYLTSISSNYSTTGFVSMFMTIINPIEYTIQVGHLLLHFIESGNMLDSYSLLIILCTTFLYISIGLFSFRKMKLLPIFRN